MHPFGGHDRHRHRRRLHLAIGHPEMRLRLTLPSRASVRRYWLRPLRAIHVDSTVIVVPVRSRSSLASCRSTLKSLARWTKYHSKKVTQTIEVIAIAPSLNSDAISVCTGATTSLKRYCTITNRSVRSSLPLASLRGTFTGWTAANQVPSKSPPSSSRDNG